MANILFNKISHTLAVTYKKMMEFVLRRKDLKVEEFDMPFYSFYNTVKNYLSVKLIKRLKKLRRSQTQEENTPETMDEHNDHSPFARNIERT